MKAIHVSILFVLILMLSLILLVNGSEILIEPLIKGLNIPIGTLIAWVGLVSFPSAIYFGFYKILISKHTIFKFYRVLLILVIIFTVFWGFISYYLAANWYFTFNITEGFRGSERAFKYFEYLSLIAVSLPVLFLLVFSIHMIFRKLGRSKYFQSL